MITSKSEYKQYLDADRIALGRSGSLKSRIRHYLDPGSTWAFQKLLRKTEYYKNCKKGLLGRVHYFYLLFLFRKKSVKLGFSIPLNVFGEGLAIVHYGTIVVNENARVGKNCRIQACTNIGASGGNSKAPQIGDNVYIGPGAKIYGDIKIGNNIAVGANSSVNKSFEKNNILIAGSPAKEIKEINIKQIIKHL